MPEITIADVSCQNVGNANFNTPGTVVVLDPPNSSITATAVKFPAAALDIPFGVVMDKTKLDPTGAVVANSGVTVRTIGVANCIASGTITAGDRVTIANTSGQVQTQAKAAAGAAPAAIVGVALNPTTAAGQAVSVQLAIGSTW